MLFFLQQGFRVIAHDRRGHGRSTQTVSGNDMDTYADDLAELTAALDLHDAIHVGHSTGGGEVARYLARHGSARVAKAVLIGAVPPLMLKTEANPGGTPIDVFDGIRAGVASNRPQFYRDITLPFYGYNRPGAKVSGGIREHWWLQGGDGLDQEPLRLRGGVLGDRLHRGPEEDRRAHADPHGDDDQIVPIGASGLLSAKLVPNATLKVYPGLPHGMCTTHPEVINPDLLAFFHS